MTTGFVLCRVSSGPSQAPHVPEGKLRAAAAGSPPADAAQPQSSGSTGQADDAPEMKRQKISGTSEQASGVLHVPLVALTGIFTLSVQQLRPCMQPVTLAGLAYQAVMKVTSACLTSIDEWSSDHRLFDEKSQKHCCQSHHNRCLHVVWSSHCCIL